MRTNFLASSKSPDIFADISQAGFSLEIHLERDMTLLKTSYMNISSIMIYTNEHCNINHLFFH